MSRDGDRVVPADFWSLWGLKLALLAAASILLLMGAVVGLRVVPQIEARNAARFARLNADAEPHGPAGAS